jgi:tryptophanyl-tRNA synthetase
MTQFKDKSQGTSDVNVGIFTYPVLQAADILLYDIDVVPVGHDQKQHVELARNIAQKFNSRYGETFKIPEPFIPEVGGRIMDLQNPDRKMSTTGGTDKGTVYILDEPAAITKKFKSAVTDSDGVVKAAREKPGVSNLLEIMSIATGKSIPDLETQFEGSGYGDFKAAVAESVVDYLAPVRERYNDLIADPRELERILADGAARARAHAREKIELVRDRVGLLAEQVPAAT